MEFEEWVEENKPLLEFLHGKVDRYVELDFEELARYFYERRDKFK